MRKETIVFNGVTFIRYPDSRSTSARRYFYPFANGRRMRGVGALHQEVWKAHHGPIPSGHHIHHKDEDWSNNDISNLEALTQSEHNRVHGNRSPAQREHFTHIQKLAAKWHGSEEGRRFHQWLGRESWKDRQPVDRACAHCGQPYQTKVGRATDRFCSRACEQRDRYHGGKHREERTCACCGKAFSVWKYKRTQECCSRICANRWRRLKPMIDDLVRRGIVANSLLWIQANHPDFLR